MFSKWFALVLALLAVPDMGHSQSASLFAGGDAAHRKPLVPLAGRAEQAPRAASLFVGTQGGGLFAPLPERTRTVIAPLSGNSPAARLRHLIAEAEAGRAHYDAVNHGARVKPPKPPTSMTIAEIYAWIARTPGQPHAIGRYQFIPSTLRRLVTDQGISPHSLFSPVVQDRLADQLLAEAGLQDHQSGALSRRQFMYRLAKIWAGLPLPTGKSYYQGVAGNKATMSWARFEQGMAQIFPG